LEAKQAPLLLIELNAAGPFEELVAAALQADADAQVILLADASEQALAGKLLKLGAADLLPRPCDPEIFRAATDRASEAWMLRRQLRCWQQSLPAPDEAALLGSAPVMRAFAERVAKLASHDASVLITGEAGSGKGHVARLIHAQSERRQARAVAFDCARLRGPRQEALLFGEAGKDGLGALEAAEGGSLILRDVEALSLPAQERLQAALKDRESRRVEGGRASKIDLRVLSLSSINLRAAVHKNLFREDLYWSLCGVALEVPALRERPGDVEELFAAFLGEACRALGRKAPFVPAALLTALKAHAFPGNVAELKQLSFLLASLSESGELSLAALPAQMMTPFNVPRSAPAGALALKPIVHEFEKQFLVRALKAVGGNQSKAARVLDIHRNTLILKMQEFGIPNKKKVKAK
jgi:DNA-binding NtrC family response regulator